MRHLIGGTHPVGRDLHGRQHARRPDAFYDTNYDHAARIDQLRETAELVGLVSDDVVLNAFPVAAVAHWASSRRCTRPSPSAQRSSPLFPVARDAVPIYRSTDEVVDRPSRRA